MDDPDALCTISSAVKQMENCYVNFQHATGEDVDGLFDKLQEIKAIIGVQPRDFRTPGIREEVSTIRETFTLMHDLMFPEGSFQTLSTTIDLLKSSVAVHQSKWGTLKLSQSELGELIELIYTE